EQNMNYSNIKLGRLKGFKFFVPMRNRIGKKVINGETIKNNRGKQKSSFLGVRDGGKAIIKMFVKNTNNGDLIYNSRKIENITLNGGNQKISYLDVRDAATALIKMIKQNPNNWYPIYNLGNIKSFTLIELVEIIKEKAKEVNFENIKIERIEDDSNYNNLMNNT